MEIIKVEMKHKVNAHEREKKIFAIEYYLFKKNKLFFIKKKKQVVFYYNKCFFPSLLSLFLFF
ncbi:hypothetical protein LguiA_007952 [Lonicera macranthoides]